MIIYERTHMSILIYYRGGFMKDIIKTGEFQELKVTDSKSSFNVYVNI